MTELDHSMDVLVLHNARVVLESEVIFGGVVLGDKRISNVFVERDRPAGLSSRQYADLNGAYLAPGMIDIHIHGAAGVDVQDTDENGFDRIGEFLLSNGVTSYFPTFVPADDEVYRSAVENIRRYVSSNREAFGAWILGVHFEGPFVSRERCGALKREFFRTYDGDHSSVELFARGVADQAGAAQGRLMTLAPEIEGGLDLVRYLTSRGVRAFIGHSTADPEVLELAFEAGARHVTHFPNALEPLHHRKPGAVAWALLRDDVTFDCIADFHHVDPLMLRLMRKLKGASGMALISDAIKPAGLGDGEFEVWGERIEVRGGRTSLIGGSVAGTIAGSVVTMLDAFRNMVKIGVPIGDVVRMSSLTPARAAGVDAEVGSIVEGKRADLIAFDDNLKLTLTLSSGKPSWSSSPD